MGWKSLPSWLRGEIYGFVFGFFIFLSSLMDFPDIAEAIFYTFLIPVRIVAEPVLYCIPTSKSADLFIEAILSGIIYSIIGAGLFILIAFCKSRGKPIYKRWWFWFFIVLIIFILFFSIYYFGIFNPARFSSTSCTLFLGLACTEFVVYSNGDVTLYVKNGLGQDVTIKSAELTTLGCSNQRLPLLIKDGQRANLTWNGCEMQMQYSPSILCPSKKVTTLRFISNIKITYMLANGATKLGTGEIRTFIEPATSTTQTAVLI